MSLTINLRNISWQPGKPAPKVCDYQYEVFVNTKCIESGIVRNHKRAEGWDSLVHQLATEREVRERYKPAMDADPGYRHTPMGQVKPRMK